MSEYTVSLGLKVNRALNNLKRFTTELVKVDPAADKAQRGLKRMGDQAQRSTTKMNGLTKAVAGFATAAAAKARAADQERIRQHGNPLARSSAENVELRKRQILREAGLKVGHRQ